MRTNHLWTAGAATLLALALFPPALAGQAAADGREPCPPDHCVAHDLGFRPRGTIQVQAGPLGSVTVRPWDRDSVHVQATVEGLGSAPARMIGVVRQVRVEASPAGVRVLSPAVRAGWAANLVVFVPRRSDLAVTVRVGGLSVQGVAGRMALEIIGSGPLTLTRVAGDVRAVTHAGPLHVVLAGSRWEGRGLNAETRNGPVTLDMPRTYSARLQAGTLNGPDMSAGFPSSPGQGSTRLIDTRLGDGGPPVRVVTFVGPATVRRISDRGR